MKSDKRITTIMKKGLHSDYLKIFIMNFMIAMLSFALLMIRGNGIFTLSNDFNEQQIPFHMLANNSLKNGGFLWNWSIDLGSSFVGALGFYVLGSPFAWISFLFPAKYYPFLVGWLYMMKYAAAGTLAYGYIKLFTSKKYAALGAVLYAFSGFQCVNLIFHHFHDAVAFFPLLLIGYEKLAKEGKKGILAFAVFVNAFVNYYFFIQEVIFLILYFLCREGIHLWKKRKLIGSCFAEGILGVGMAGIVFIPSVFFTMQNPRITRLLPVDHWIYSGNRDFLQIIRTLLFPGELMCSQSCIKEYDWTSWSAYLPMIGLSLVLCYLLKNWKNWLGRILLIGIAATGIPLINSAFGMFSDTNYHRWLYMLILLMSLASAIVMENRKDYPIKKVSFLLFLFMCFITIGSFWWSENKFQLIYQPKVFLVWSITGIMGVLLTCLITFGIKKERSYFFCMCCAVISFSIFTTGYTAELYHRISTQTSQQYYSRIMAFQDFTLPDDRYRLDSSDNTLLMTASLPGTGSFTSMVNASIYDFYEALGTSRPVFTPETPEGTRELLGGKYYVSTEIEEDTRYLQKVSSSDKDYYLYEYDLAVPIGSAYNMYMTSSDFLQLPNEIRPAAMLKCIIVSDDEEYKVSELLQKYDPHREGEITTEKIEKYVQERNREASETLEKSTGGFACTISADKKKYAFFSVPYDKGYKAYVNGNKVEILKTNGMMAIPLENGLNEIKFVYINYDLITGLISTIVFFVLWILYKGGKRLKSVKGEEN